MGLVSSRLLIDIASLLSNNSSSAQESRDPAKGIIYVRPPALNERRRSLPSERCLAKGHMQDWTASTSKLEEIGASGLGTWNSQKVAGHSESGNMF